MVFVMKVRFPLWELLSLIVALGVFMESFYILSPLRSWSDTSSLSTMISALISIGAFCCCFSGLLMKTFQKSEAIFYSDLKRFLVPLFSANILICVLWEVLVSFFGLKVPLANIINALLYVPLIFFIPGYALIHCLDKRTSLNPIEKVIFAILLSMALTSYIGLLLSIMRFSFIQGRIFIKFLLLLENITFVLLYALESCQNRDKSPLDMREAIFVFGVWMIIFPSALAFITKLSSFSLVHGIMLAHYNNGVKAFEAKYDEITGAMGKGAYPFLFSMFLATLFCISGEPTIQWFMILSFFKPLELIAYYLMVKVVFNKDTAINATSLYVGMGFGGLLTLMYTSFTPVEELSDWKVLLGSVVAKVHPDALSLIFLDIHPSVISVPMLYLSIYLLYSRDKFSRKTFLSLLTILLFTMYLTHLVELVIFSVFLTLWLIVNIKSSRSLVQGKDISLVLSGIVVLGYLLEWIIGTKPFTQWIGITSLVFLPLLLTFFPRKLLTKLANFLDSTVQIFITNKLRSVWIPSCLVLILAYVFMYSHINTTAKWYDFHPPKFGNWIIPPYMYPMIFGFSFIYLVFLLTFAHDDVKTNNNVRLFIFILILAILMEQILSVIHLFRLPLYLAEYPIVRRTPLELLFNITNSWDFWIKFAIFPLGGLFITYLASNKKLLAVASFSIIWILGFLTYLYNIILLGLSWHVIQ